MKYRKLGSLTVSEIGFGAWGIGGLTEGATSYGPADDIVSRNAIMTALANGINFFDTSNVYGDGHSEELIGEVLQQTKRRDLAIISTKGGLLKHHSDHDLSSENLRTSLEKSLGRLQTDYLDLYQLHSPTLTAVESWKAIETLYRFREEGLIKELGLSLKSPQDGIPAIEMGFKILQVNFSMIDQRAWDGGLLELAKEKNVSIIARTPFCFGFLSGQIRSKQDLNFGPRDHRSTWPKEQLESWLAAAEIFKVLNLDHHPRRLHEMALKFCLYPKVVSTVIPGIQTPYEAAENAMASAWPDLTEEEMMRIRKVYQENQFHVVKS